MTEPSTGSVPIVGRILVVDDEELVRKVLTRVLTGAGHTVVATTSAEAALEAMQSDGFDVILTDLNLPTADGLHLLRTVRTHDLDVPVVFLTGQPTVDSAARALEYGAFRYLVKPIMSADLLNVVTDALRARTMARAADPMRDRRELERAFRSALDGLWMAFQPIVSTEVRQTIGFEALMRSREPALPHPGAVIEAAEKLGAVHLLGRTVRERIAATIDGAPPGPTFFVNVHPADLADVDLYEPSAPLSQHASRIVIELTERSTLEGVPDLEERLGALRGLGYRIAVDDLGAGYAGLSYFASVHPDVIKIDMSLVRGVDRDPVRQRVVLALAGLGRSMGIEVVGEGVETAAERDALVRLQCTHLQGYLFAKPGRPFPIAAWDGAE